MENVICKAEKHFEGFTAEYFLTEEKYGTEKIYSVFIVKRAGDNAECGKAPYLTKKKRKATAFFDLIVKNGVTPVLLNDVAEEHFF